MNEIDAVRVKRTEQLVVLVDIALTALSQRLITIISLLLNTGIFGWAIFTESYPRLLGAALFAVAGWCTVHLRPKEKPHES